MTELFLDVLNASYAASFVVLAVILARLPLKKAPRWMVCALWALVAVRLLVPGILETSFSLVPSREIIPPQSLYDAAPQIQSGFDSIDKAVNPVYSESLRPAPGASVNPLQVWLAVFANVWFLGALVMGLWALVSCIRVRRRLRERVRVEGNIFLCDNIDSPFIFGLFRPMICLPGTLGEEARQHVIAHERAHLARRDHWWKPLGFLLLTINWFNPLMWVAYILLCRDIEMACDEKVIRDLAVEEKKSYSAALLSCSINPRQITACPLAFGEVGVKQRVRSVLNYKKPAFWVILVTAAVAIALAVGLLTNPKSGDAESRWDSVLYIQEGRAVKTLPEDAVAVGTLDSILVQEIGQPEYHHPDQNGQAVHLDGSYTGQPLHLADGVLYLMEPGGKSWLPFAAKHTTLDVHDLLKQDVQCNFVLRGSEVSISEFLSDDAKATLRELLAPASLEAQPTLGWTWEMNAVNYVEDLCFVIDNRDFTRHALLTRREEGWLMVYRDEGWAISAWTFQSPELDAFIAPWQGELAFAQAQFSPFAAEDAPVHLEYLTAALPDVSVRLGVPGINIGTDVTDAYWEYQSHVAYQDRTIEIRCRPFGREDWMRICYRDQSEPLSTYGFVEMELTLANGVTGTLYHANDPERWSEIVLNTTRGQLYVTAPNAALQQTDWTSDDYRMALAILSTMSLTENGNSLFGEGNPLGLTGTLENLTPSGATLVIHQDGTLWDKIITGSDWMLEQKVDGEWVSIMPESMVWTTVAYLLDPGCSWPCPLNWGQIVGELGPGEYRVGKHFTGERSPMFTLGLESEEVEQTCYAEFTIEAPETVLPAPVGFSAELQQILRNDWAAYEAMSPQQQLFSSRMPGHCVREFENWADVEEFVGINIPNPLENLEGLDRGSWTAMPVGYSGASRFYITWYGDREGRVQWVDVRSGYRRDGMRISVSAALYADSPENDSLEEGWGIEHERLRYLQSCPNGETLIVAEPGEEYEARTGYLARGPILYSIRVIGGHGNGDAAQALLEELLPHFEEIVIR